MDTLVIVIGGSRGLGAAICRTAPAGCRLIDVSRSGAGRTTEHIQADLSDPGTWRRVGARMAAAVAAQPWDRTVCLQVAAVITPIGFAGTLAHRAYERHILLNSAAPQALGNHFLAAVADRPGRHQLCMISSGAATTPMPGLAAYGAAKAAVEQWIRTVGSEQERIGTVEVCAISPGMVDTPMHDALRDVDARDFPHVEIFRQARESGQLQDPHDIAGRLWALLDRGVDNGAVIRLPENLTGAEGGNSGHGPAS